MSLLYNHECSTEFNFNLSNYSPNYYCYDESTWWVWWTSLQSCKYFFFIHLWLSCQCMYLWVCKRKLRKWELNFENLWLKLEPIASFELNIGKMIFSSILFSSVSVVLKSTVIFHFQRFLTFLWKFCGKIKFLFVF